MAEQLMSAGLVRRPSDLYRLTAQQLLGLEGFQERSVENLLKSLEDSKSPMLARWVLVCIKVIERRVIEFS